MIALVHLLSECAGILHHFSLTKIYGQQKRVVYQKPFAYDLALLFITSIGMQGRAVTRSENSGGGGS